MGSPQEVLRCRSWSTPSYISIPHDLGAFGKFVEASEGTRFVRR
jgi:hypothetical protein